MKQNYRSICKRIGAFLLVGVSLITGCGNTTPENNGMKSSETEVLEKDESVNIRPQDDYYGYVNANDLLKVDVANYNMDVGPFELATEQASKKLDKELERIVHSENTFQHGSKEEILQLGYQYFMEYYDESEKAMKNKDNVRTTVEDNIKRIRAATNTDELLAIMFELQKDNLTLNMKNDWTLSVSMDPKNPEEYCIKMSPIMNICYVSLEDIEKWENNVSRMENTQENCLMAAGMSEEEAKKVTKELAHLIVALTWGSNIEALKAYGTNDELKYMEFVSYEELDQMLTNVNYKDIERYQGIMKSPYKGWYVTDKNQLKTLNDLFVDANLEALKAWFIGEYIMTCGETLRDTHKELKNFFPKSKTNVEKQVMEELKCNPLFADEISALYVETTYSEKLEKELRGMCEDICKGYESEINNANWLSEALRKKLICKLHNMVIITGKDVDVKALNEKKAECFSSDYSQTCKNLNQYMYEELIDHIGAKYDKCKPSMSMSDVNACYSTENVVTIPVAIMSEPIYDSNQDYYSNLGSLGSVIAHEIGHAFDSNCMEYNENGEYCPEWILEQDRAALEERAQKAIYYFENTFPVFDVYYVDGKNTLGENYADLGGMEVLTSICKTDKEWKMVTENYARLWCGIISSQTLTDQLEYDVHSPSVIRVNAILATLDSFYEMYDVKETDGMYVDENMRIGRWE